MRQTDPVDRNPVSAQTTPALNRDLLTETQLICRPSRATTPAQSRYLPSFSPASRSLFSGLFISEQILDSFELRGQISCVMESSENPYIIVTATRDPNPEGRGPGVATRSQ